MEEEKNQEEKTWIESSIQNMVVNDGINQLKESESSVRKERERVRKCKREKEERVGKWKEKKGEEK